jgi:hypothetical protein
MKLDKAETLADRIYMLTSQRDIWPWAEREHLRSSLFQARRFVLDDTMSAFLCDLSMTAFFKNGPIKVDHREGQVDFPVIDCSKRVALRKLEQLRLGAKLPHKFTWIEFNLTACFERSVELGHVPPEPHSEIPEREGWLLITTGELCHASVFATSSVAELWAFPWSYAWTTSDAPVFSLFPPGLYTTTEYWRKRAKDWERDLGVPLSAMATGMLWYRTDTVEIMRSMFNPIVREDHKRLEQEIELMASWAGCIRRMWAFLATINDIPVLRREVKASKGFMARGSYKRFLDHHTITLTVPVKKDMRTLARHVVALARRRAHMVRGHFRKDWRHPPSPLCEHEWSAEQVCKYCAGHRLWVHEHQRGDANLGITLTDYAVTHGE